MAKSLQATILVFVMTIAAICFAFATTTPQPRIDAVLVTVAGATMIAVKFGIADILSNKGFQFAKAGADMMVTLCGTMFSFAVLQQFAARAILPGLAQMIVPYIDIGGDVRYQATIYLWIGAAFAAALAALSVRAVWVVNMFDKLAEEREDAGMSVTLTEPEKWRRRMWLAMAVTCFSVGYGLNIVVTISKAS